jgi:hypothetical protein
MCVQASSHNLFVDGKLIKIMLKLLLALFNAVVNLRLDSIYSQGLAQNNTSVSGATSAASIFNCC